MQLADRLRLIKASATLVLNQKAQEMQAEGRLVTSLTAGEPDMGPAKHILEAMNQALIDGHTRYTAVGGIPELKESIRKLYQSRGLSYQAHEIIVSNGAKQSLFNALLCLLNPGDEAIIPAPYWLSYVDMVRLTHARDVVIQTKLEDNFILQPEALLREIRPQTRVLFLNSPSNPTGSVYSKEALNALAEVLRKHPQITVLSDEIYDQVVYHDPERAPSILEVAPDLRDRVLIVNGCSKTYAMTGIRVGWSLGPKELINAMTKLQGQSTSNVCTPAQYAAIAALDGPQESVRAMVETFALRKKFVLGRLRNLEGIRCTDPGGAFYVFPDVSGVFGRRLPDGSQLQDAFALCAYLLHEFALITVPGGPFGADQHIRLSFAADMETLARGLSLLSDALGSLRA